MKPSIQISILIVTRKWHQGKCTFDSIINQKDDSIDFEVLLAEGNNPSSQRNKLAQHAKGDYILFLDDDSQPRENLLERYHQTLKDYPDAEILGGPALLFKKNNLLFGLSNIFFSSSFGIGPVKSRYNSIGPVRAATEKDLILCNLLMKRDFFLKTKGFDRNLYPGEENEFLKNLKSGVKILYDPNAVVYKEPRETFFQFLEQMVSYGNGRSRHWNFNYFFEYLFFIPLLFTLYVLSLSFILNRYSSLYLLPVAAHFSLSLMTVYSIKSSNLTTMQKCFVPFFFFMGHFCYGLGLVMGLSNKILKRGRTCSLKDQIQIYGLKSFKKNSTS